MQIYDWIYDFERSDEVFLVIGGQESELRIPEQYIDTIAVHMLASGQQNLVQPFVENVDQGVRIFYPITGMRLLADELKSMTMSMSQVLQWLLRIIEKLEHSRELLLNDRNFVLVDELIFVEEDSQELQLIYLPLKDINGAGTLQEQLHNLMESWSHKVDHCPIGQWRMFMQQFSDENFSLIKLKKWCQDQLLSEPKFPHVQSGKEEIDEAVESKEKLHDDDVEQREEIDYVQELIPLEEAATSALLSSSNIQNKGLNVLKNKVLVSVGFGLLLLSVIVCLIIPFPASEIVLIASILLIIAGLAIMILLDRKKEHPEHMQQQTMDINEEEKQSNSDLAPTFPWPEVKSAYRSSHVEPATTLLSSDEDKTVLLTPSSQEKRDSKEWSFTLKISSPNEVGEKLMNLDQHSFVIGREAETVDHISHQTGVSRRHCELICTDEGDGFSVRDLGSKNGTFLNEQHLVPFKKYPLQSGDRIRILDEEYEFQRRKNRFYSH